MEFYDRHVFQVVTRMMVRKSTLILTGPRQVGKSTLLTHMLPDTRYTTLDDPILRLNAEENPGGFIAQNPPPVIIDEIQKTPSMLDYIKMQVDSAQTPGQYFLTGSHMWELMEGVQESLAGRAGIIRMLGLSQRELSGTKYSAPFIPTAEHFELIQPDSFDYHDTVKFIHGGSFPELHKLGYAQADWKDFHSSYLQSYIEKDVKDQIRSENMSAFTKFIRGCASLSGEQLNTTLLGEMCGMSANTVKSWLSVLEKGGHIFLLRPYSGNENKRLVKLPKLYFLDTGLLCFLSGWHTPEQMVNGARWGHIFETFIFAEILKSYYNDGTIYPPIYYYRDKDKVEIDLIIEDGDTLHPIEIKTTSQPTNRMVKQFATLDRFSKKRSSGALICMYGNALALNDRVMSIHPGMI
ncbi:MAG: ATP-binding protein [Defluviitaleaceae bacterium]|nr:ATP-binding protein [Defluviitaleaceae bacterium]